MSLDDENEIESSWDSRNLSDPSNYLTIISCTISLCCGLLICVFFGRGRLHLGTCHFMFIFLTMADMMTAGGNLFGVINKILAVSKNSSETSSQNQCSPGNAACVAQSFITTWSSMCCFLWTIVIEVYCFMCIWNRRHHIALSRPTKCAMFALCWFMPLSITAMAFGFGALGQDNSATSGGWCWITSCQQHIDRYDRIVWMLFTGKLWEILSYLTISNLILLEIYRVYSLSHQRNLIFDISETAVIIPVEAQRRETRSDEQRRYELQKFLFWIPMFLILARIWGTMRFFFNVAEIVNGSVPKSVSDANKVLIYFHGIGDSSQATCNFILAMIFLRRPNLLRSEASTRRTSVDNDQSLRSIRD